MSVSDIEEQIKDVYKFDVSELISLGSELSTVNRISTPTGTFGVFRPY